MATGRVLTIGAHAADQELAAGMQIAKYARAGYDVTVLSLTPGEKGHPTLSAEDYARQKIEEARGCTRILGAETIILGYGDALLAATQAIALEVADIIRELRPDVVITHWKNSIHTDHRNAHIIAQDALFYAALPRIERSRPAHWVPKVFYSENWEDMEGFEPDVYVETTEVFDQYCEALSSFALWEGGTGWPYSRYYQALATTRACLGGGLRWEKAAAMMRPREELVERTRELP
ncbi:MAG TPA: PIG-L deacetylase family protein [Chloroflexota bacterium]|nr:PIG-L deacetylase family protein [Chloroflexota bacterium]